MYLEGAPNFKNQPWLKSITITNIQNSTLNLSFDALLKWHDPDIRQLALMPEQKRSVPAMMFAFVENASVHLDLVENIARKMTMNLFVRNWVLAFRTSFCKRSQKIPQQR